jgi:SdrD B-like protein/carboxypeptidase family protein
MKRFKYLTLAALVALAACDEGEEPPTVVVVTGTVSGVVTLEGSSASGVTVTLSSGQTGSTDGSGAYSFAGVAAGAYTVTISGFASDASFSATVKAVTISTAGQVATANFDGSYIRTSAILGAVTGGGTALVGVTVTLSGQSSASFTTLADGQYSFSGLRAGSYTVSISGQDNNMYSFTSTSSSVTLGVGSSEVVSFSGSLLTTAKISGWLFLDENDKDDMFSSGLEDAFTVANVTVTAEGGPVSATPQWTTETDANGYFEFDELAAGSYRVTLATADADIPGNVAFGGTTAAPVVEVDTGENEVVNFAFDITQQRVDVFGFLGIDDESPGIAPVDDWNIILYDTQANAAGAVAAGELGDEDTDAAGGVMFRFDREDDVSPNEAVTDRIVFAAITAAPTATHAVNGEMIIEISYNAKDSVVMAPDTFDAQYGSITLKTTVAEIDDDVAAGWATELDVAEDADDAVKSWSRATDADGEQFWTVSMADAATMGGDGALPDTLWFKLSAAQATAGGHGFESVASLSAGGTVDKNTGGEELIGYEWDGTVNPTDTVDVGSFAISYTDQDVTVRVHHELDDSTDVPTYTLGDGFGYVSQSEVELYEIEADGDTVSIAGPTAAAVGTGLVTFLAVDPDKTLFAAARATHPKQFVLNDSTISIPLDGSDQTYTDKTLAGGAGSSSFATKTHNNTVSGSIEGDDGTAVEDIIVTMTPTTDNIQGTAMMVDTTDGAGDYTFSGVTEGPYTVSVVGIADEWDFADKLVVASAPLSSGVADNDDAMTASRDVEGDGGFFWTNFQPDALDTEIHGVVVNDRDSDFNTLDPDEALSGVTVNVYNDDDGDGAIDAADDLVIGTTTTDANGAYSFTALREGDYIVEAVSPSNATVLRALDGTGAVTNWIGVTTEPGAGNCALADCTNQDDTKTVGNVDPAAQDDELPRWSYLTGVASDDAGNLGGGAGPNATNGAATTAPSNFVHLFATGTVTGTLVDDGGDAVTTGVTVTITRCQTLTVFATPPSPPAGLGAAACTKHGLPSEHIQNFDVTAGSYTFNGLLEGVYLIEVAPATGGYTTNIGLTGAAGDESVVASVIGNNDVETVAAFEVN